MRVNILISVFFILAFIQSLVIIDQHRRMAETAEYLKISLEYICVIDTAHSARSLDPNHPCHSILLRLSQQI